MYETIEYKYSNSHQPLLLSLILFFQVVHYFVNFLGKLGISAQSGSHLPEVLDSLLRFLTAVHARSRLSKMEAANNVRTVHIVIIRSVLWLQVDSMVMLRLCLLLNFLSSFTQNFRLRLVLN